MAKDSKSTTKRTTRKSRPRKTPEKTLEQKIVAATLKLAKDVDWADLKLSQVAKEARVSLSDLTKLYSSKTEILAAHAGQVDEKVLGNLDPELENEPARERLLDILISRIETLTPDKEALRRIRKTIARDPFVMATLNQVIVSSMNRMLIAASCETGGLRGLARAQGLAYVYKSAVEVWLEDDDPGLARTMAELDGRLRRGERVLKRANMAFNLASGAAGVCKSLRKQARERREKPPAEDAVAT